MVACGALSLAVAGGIGVGVSALFFVLLIAAWACADTRWQLSSRVSLVLVLLALPLFYIEWKWRLFSSLSIEPERAGINSLTHFILFLALVKLWQTKTDRDWLFLYLISFFEILLAAGLSVSPSFLFVLALYVLCAISTVVSFEIRKARRSLSPAGAPRLTISLEPTRLRRLTKRHVRQRSVIGEVRRLPLIAVGLLLLIFSLALPLFFIAPRFSGSAVTRASGGTTGLVGFSDEVSLGEIARLERSNRLVMRVRVDEPELPRHQDLRWRGVALDQFDGRTWRRSDPRPAPVNPKERALFQFDTTESLERLTTQTFFIEPVDTPVLFIAPRAIAVQGALPFVRRDREGGLISREHSQERISYRAYSDTTEPPAERLRADLRAYLREDHRYLVVPDGLDPRIADLTRGLIAGNRAGNRYDSARVVEEYLRQNFRYSLDLKATGADPLADFLFRVRAGNCEYFASAMAIMLRTAGVATRVVNGFQTGEYNAMAGAFTVKQSDAHSWVEVYFPETDAWLTFDPTPASARTNAQAAGGLSGRLQQYAEALELFWIQYVVAYDRQEQRSLASSLREQLGSYRLTALQTLDEWRAGLADWWSEISGRDTPRGNSFFGAKALWLLLPALIAAIGYVAWRALRKYWGGSRGQSLARRKFDSAIIFYNRMTKALAGQGLRRAADQTPLEFAFATGIPEALLVTEAYNRVRYGAQDLSSLEAARVEEWLRKIEQTQ